MPQIELKITLFCKICSTELKSELKGDNIFVELCPKCLKKETVRIMREFADEMSEK